MSRSTWGTPQPPANDAAALPTVCPACRSAAISTTAKAPDAASYWRCAGCGEIWNAGRRDDHAPVGDNRWRSLR